MNVRRAARERDRACRLRRRPVRVVGLTHTSTHRFDRMLGPTAERDDHSEVYRMLPEWVGPPDRRRGDPVGRPRRGPAQRRATREAASTAMSDTMRPAAIITARASRPRRPVRPRAAGSPSARRWLAGVAGRPAGAPAARSAWVLPSRSWRPAGAGVRRSPGSSPPSGRAGTIGIGRAIARSVAERGIGQPDGQACVVTTTDGGVPVASCHGGARISRKSTRPGACVPSMGMVAGDADLGPGPGRRICDRRVAPMGAMT
jgi:hypothetical protein